MKNKLYNNLKQNLDNLDVPNSDKVWKVIEERLDERDSKKGVFNYRYNLIFLDLISLGILSFSLLSLRLPAHTDILCAKTSSTIHRVNPMKNMNQFTKSLSKESLSNEVTNKNTPTKQFVDIPYQSSAVANNNSNILNKEPHEKNSTPKKMETINPQNGINTKRENIASISTREATIASIQTMLLDHIPNATIENNFVANVNTVAPYRINETPTDQKKYYLGLSSGFAFNHLIAREPITNSKVTNSLFYVAKQMHVELFSDIEINKKITLQPSIQFMPYNFRDTSFGDTTFIKEYTYRCYFVDIGMNATFSVYKNLYVGTGLYLGIKQPLIGGREETNFPDYSSSIYVSSPNRYYKEINSIDIGASLKVGYLHKNWSFELKYKQGLLDAVRNQKGYQPKYAIVIGIGYRFQVHKKAKQ